MSAHHPLFPSPHLASRWRVTGHRGAFRIYEVTAIDAETGEFTMVVREDSRDGRDPGRLEVGWTMGVEANWFVVRGQMASGKEGSVKPA